MAAAPRFKPSLAVALAFILLAASTAVVSQTQTEGSPAALAAPPPPVKAPTLVERGRYLATAGDCVACHTPKGAAPYSGGRALRTPFGTLLSANITPDRATGIGLWSADQFYRALHRGIDDKGRHLYPAFPYNYYTRVSRQDADAIFAYLRTVPPAHNAPRRNQLPFPFNIRALMTFWNWLFFHPGQFAANPAKSADWNRGAYLVEGLGHCGACHTPMNLFGAPKETRHLQGGMVDGWFAPDLTVNPRTGLGAWSRSELVEFLKTGRNAHASAAVAMGEVVAVSTSAMSDADLGAMATYLADRRSSPASGAPRPEPRTMAAGETIFVDSCSACHGMQGEGSPRFFPPLRGDANLQQADPTTSVRFILAGVQSTPTAARPTGVAMPAYAWKLSDGQIAAVATYVRNAWGNRAPALSAAAVAKLRRKTPAAAGGLSAPKSAGALTRPGPDTLAPAGTDSRDNGTARAGQAAR